MTLYINF